MGTVGGGHGKKQHGKRIRLGLLRSPATRAQIVDLCVELSCKLRIQLVSYHINMGCRSVVTTLGVEAIVNVNLLPLPLPEDLVRRRSIFLFTTFKLGFTGMGKVPVRENRLIIPPPLVFGSVGGEII